MNEVSDSSKVLLRATYTVNAVTDRSYCTMLSAEIPLNANTHVRLYNIPEDSTVKMYEIDRNDAWQLCLCDWENADSSHALYGSAAAAAGMGKSGTPDSMATYTDTGVTGEGVEHAVTALNAHYAVTFYNRLLPMDLELKKIDALTAARSVVSLTDETTPAGSGSTYDDAALPGLANAVFVLYRRMEPEAAVSDMAANGLVWLKPDGTTATGAKPEGAVQVLPAKDGAGHPVVTVAADGKTNANGRLRFKSLLPGTYYLVETVPPDSYAKPTPPPGSVGYLTVNLAAGSTTYVQPDANGGVGQNALSRIERIGTGAQAVFELVVTNTSGGTELPRTGGVGCGQYTVLGAALILLGAVALLIKESRAKGGRTKA